MSTAVWKFRLDLGTPHDIRVPKFSKVLCVREQCNEICVWCEVDTTPNAPQETIHLEVWATGQKMVVLESHLERRYLNSIFPQNAAFVFHIYQVVLRGDL